MTFGREKSNISYAVLEVIIITILPNLKNIYNL